MSKGFSAVLPKNLAAGKKIAIFEVKVGYIFF
jgi:hypothetical protein